MTDSESGEGRRRGVESVIVDLIKRAVELGVHKATEAPDNLKAFVQDLKVPREVATYLLSQVDETKNGLFRVVAKEMRDFLEHTNIAGELQKALTSVQFEVNTTIRFRPNDGTATEDKAKPEVKTQVHVRKGRSRETLVPPEKTESIPPTHSIPPPTEESENHDP